MEFNKTKDQNSVIKAYNMLLYFSGSMIMYEPVEECVIDFWSKGILKTLPVKSCNPRFVLAASQLRESCKDKTICKTMLQEDFNRLISGKGVPLAPPLKSNYIDSLIKEEPGAERVTDFYNSYGWEKRSRYNVPDDNLGIELLFLTLLLDKYIALDDEVCLKEMRKEIRRFLTNHILSWLPEWNERMQEYSQTLCYKGIATLIYACCEDIYGFLTETKPEISFPTEFKN
jgi:TorA maturation chaperone TorD